MGWDDALSSKEEVYYGNFSLSIKFKNNFDSFKWWLTGVYGSCTTLLKTQFLDELRHLQTFIGDRWVIGGDFTITRFSYEKSNRSFYTPLMANFDNFITEASLIDLSPNNYSFT